MKRKLRICAAVLLAFGMLLSGCGKKEAVNEAGVAGETEAVDEPVETEKAGTEEEAEITALDETAEDSAGQAEEKQEEENTVVSVTEEPSPVGASPAGTPYEVHGPLSVTGTLLTDQNGKTTVLHGVSTHGLSWFPQYANKDAFRTIRDEWGVDTIRLAMYTAEYNGYCTGDANNKTVLKNLIYDCVDAATELGMYVIVDWHVLQDQNPNTYKDQAIAFFTEVSGQLKDYGNVIYEICNEPNGGVGWQEIKSYAKDIIPVIRQNAPDAVIIVGTPTWSQEVDKAAADPITGYDNIVYALHFYADTHRDDLRNKMVSAIQNGLPVFVSEYGICDASGNGSINPDQAAQWLELLQQYNVSFCVWNLSNKSETSALIRSDCSKVSDWTYDELSASGQWYVDWMREHAGAEPVELGQNAQSAASGNGGTNDVTTGQNPAQNNGQSNSQGSNTALQASAADGSLNLTAKVTNQWETDGKYYYQCEIHLSNQGMAKINGWQFELSADSALELSQGWCGSFSVSGGTVTVTPESYNATIDAGTERGDIGLIFCTDRRISGLRATVSAK